MVAFLNGYDIACGKALLDGLREWIAAKLGYGWNLVYWVLAEKLIFPDGRPEEPWSPEAEQRAVAGLIGLTDEYFDILAGNPEERPKMVGSRALDSPPGEPGTSVETTQSPTVASDATSWR